MPRRTAHRADPGFPPGFVLPTDATGFPRITARPETARLVTTLHATPGPGMRVVVLRAAVQRLTAAVDPDADPSNAELMDATATATGAALLVVTKLAAAEAELPFGQENPGVRSEYGPAWEGFLAWLPKPSPRLMEHVAGALIAARAFGLPHALAPGTRDAAEVAEHLAWCEEIATLANIVENLGRMTPGHWLHAGSS